MTNPKVSELLMFYNVENLFPADSPQVHHLDPTNSGLKNWDDGRYKNKIGKIAHVLELVKEEQLVLPALIGLAEIQGDNSLQDIISQPIFDDNYAFIHYESLDERGVDVALIYDKTKCEVLHSEPISFIFEFENPGTSSFDTTRDVLFCKIKIRNEIFDYYLIHLPSKREKDINKPKREYILKQIKERIAEERESDKNPVIVFGDFNDNPDELIIKDFANHSSAFKLINPFEKLFNEKQFSTFHNSSGLLFDQFLLSQEFFEKNNSTILDQAKVFNHPKLGSWDRKQQGRPFRTYSGTRYLGGYSDHYPVLIKLNFT